MKKYIFVSDFHMGLKGKLKSFDENAENKFLDAMQYWGKKEIISHLVLLGDIFDLLQIQEEQMLNKTEIRNIQIGYTPKSEAIKVQRSLEIFPKFSQALNKFLACNKNNRITYIYGNHDHSFVNKNVQDALLSNITEEHRNRFDFAFYIEDKEAGFYAEHGNQLDPNNCFLDPTKFEPECPGSIFVLLYWNKIKMAMGDVDALEPWYDIFEYLWNKRKSEGLKAALSGIPKDIAFASKLYIQYRERPDVITPVKLEKEGVLSIELPKQYPIPCVPGFPEQIINPIEGVDYLFSIDSETEQAYRDLFCNNEEFRKIIQKLYKELHGKDMLQAYIFLIEKPQQKSGPIMGAAGMVAGALSWVTWGRIREKLLSIHDPFLAGIKAWYGIGKTSSYPLKGYDSYPEPLCKKVLDPHVHRNIILGHTHSAIDGTKTDPIVLSPGKKIHYHNTGTWKYFVNSSYEIKRKLTYLEITIGNGTPVYEMKEVH